MLNAERYLQPVLHVRHLRNNFLILRNLPVQQTQLASQVGLQTEKHNSVQLIHTLFTESGCRRSCFTNRLFG